MRTDRLRVEFPGSQGHTLAGRLDRPATRARATALFAHCFTCGKDLAAASRIAAALAARGIAVLRFDFTGLGHSEGEFANTNFSSNVDDLVAAAAYLRREHEAPSLLVGHSLGGTAVLAAASRIPEVRAVATIAAPADPAQIRHLLEEDWVEEIERSGQATVSIAGRTFQVHRQFLEDIEAQRLDAHIAGLGRALLVLHAPGDDIVGIGNASRIFLAARHPKSFVSLDDADHLLSRRRDAEYASEVLAGWASRYLPPAESHFPRADDQGEVVVSESGEGPYGHTGPTPYGLLLASLGSCTTMTLRMYAERKGLPLEHVTVRLRHEKIHARDCETCESETGKIDRIDREIVLEGPLDEAQRARLLEIADRCPVHRTLHSEVVVSGQPAEA